MKGQLRRIAGVVAIVPLIQLSTSLRMKGQLRQSDKGDPDRAQTPFNLPSNEGAVATGPRSANTSTSAVRFQPPFE